MAVDRPGPMARLLGVAIGLAAAGTVLAVIAAVLGMPIAGRPPEAIGFALLVGATIAGAARSRLRGERMATGLYLLGLGGLITFVLASDESVLSWIAVASLAIAGVGLFTQGISADDQSTR